MADGPEDNADWHLTSWDGANLERLRKWASLPLERIIAALEEMQRLDGALHGTVGEGVREDAGYCRGPRSGGS